MIKCIVVESVQSRWSLSFPRGSLGTAVCSWVESPQSEVVSADSAAEFQGWAGEGLLPGAADLVRDRCPTELGFGAAATAGDKITTKRFIAQSAVGGGARLLLLSAVFAARIKTRGECKCLRQ